MDIKTTVFNGIELSDEPIETIIQKIKKNDKNGISYMVTPNADHFYRLDKKGNDKFLDSYKLADLRVCDSRIIQKLSILEKQKIKNVVPGSDLTKRILEDSWFRDKNILLIGPPDDDSKKIKGHYKLENLESYCPPMGFINDSLEVSKCIDIILSKNSDLVLLAVGSPQQEILAYKAKIAGAKHPDLKTTMLCIGASIDFLSGKAKRAPNFMQILHIEWLHRALSHPTRLIPRYTKNFFWIISFVKRRLAS